MKYFFLFACAVIFLSSSCYYDNLGELHPETGLNQTCNPDTTSVSFANDIQPIFAESCGSNNSCHQAIGNTSEVSLANYDDASAMASTGQLVGSTTWSSGYAAMPQGSSAPLDDCRLNKIVAWVNQGLKP